MERIAKFSKVSLNRFKEDWQKNYPDSTESEIEKIYQEIKLPIRLTQGSAGYDFFLPQALTLSPKQNKLIPTGIRVEIATGWFLGIFPKSGLGFKYRLQVDNTVGIIDSDYFYSDNEGHIFIKITNDNNEDKVVTLKQGSSFCQGIFLPFGITYEDNVTSIRNGGLGSTSK